MGIRGVFVKRVAQAIITVFIALSIDFVFFYLLPGDPVSLLARNPNISEAVQQRIIAEFGLDQPLHVQYFLFLGNFLTGNLGVSFHFQKPIQDIVVARLTNTLILILPATLVSIATGIWIGKRAAWKRGEKTDLVALLLSLVTYSIPSFWLSMFLIMVFSVNLGFFPLTPWNPALSATDPLGFLADLVSHLVLPWGVLWFALIGVFALIMRNALLDVLSEDYMITAKAKGRSEKEQLNKEATPNAMIPVATIIALNIGASVAGALQVEVIFTYPGIGRLLWDGVLYRDYPLLQATFFIITTVVIAANLIADFTYYILDPRIRVGTEYVISDRMQESFLRRAFSPFRILLAALLAANLMVIFVLPSQINLALILSACAVATLRWRSLSGFVILRLKSYSLTDLRFLWSQHRARLIGHLSKLALTLSLGTALLVVVSNVYGITWTVSWGGAFIGATRFPPNLGLTGMSQATMIILSTISSPAIVYSALAGLLLAYFFERKKQSLNLFKQFISTPMGIVGTITVAFFVGLAVYGDILAPYNPQQHLTGMPFTAPSPLPHSQMLIVILSVLMIGMGVILALYSYTAKIRSPPEGFSGGILGGTLLTIAVLLGGFSFSENHSTGVIAAGVIVLLGAYLIYTNRKRVRGHDKKMIQKSMPVILSSVFLAVGFVFFIISAITVITQNPTTFPGFHILGTDQLGRDTFSQLVIGVRITLVIGFVATLITMTIGTMIGLLAGYYGGMLDSLLMRFTDVFFVIPSLVIMIILAAILPPSVYTLIFIIGIFSWPSTARIVRGQVLTIKERGYIDRVRAVGGSNVYIMGKHVLPAVAPLIVANTVLVTAYAILSEIVLDFFGLGDPSMVSWGTMLYQAFGSGAMSSNLYWLVFPPGIAVVLLLMGVSMVGYAMDEIANPKLRRR